MASFWSHETEADRGEINSRSCGERLVRKKQRETVQFGTNSMRGVLQHFKWRSKQNYIFNYSEVTLNWITEKEKKKKAEGTVYWSYTSQQVSNLHKSTKNTKPNLQIISTSWQKGVVENSPTLF